MHSSAYTDMVFEHFMHGCGRLRTRQRLAQGGKIKALGITSLKRAAAAPDIPTVEESGMTGFAFVSWYGLWGPKNLPTDVANKLQADVAKVLALPDVKARLNGLGFGPMELGGGQFAGYAGEQVGKY